MPIRLSCSQVEKLIAHARAGLPNEACGLLVGREGRVDHVLPMTNIEPSPVSYHMDPGEQFQAQRWMRERGLSMVGIYHSHPVTSPVPSARDIGLAAYPEAVYLIVGLGERQPDVRAYRINDERVMAEDLVIDEETDGR